jgi:hypothetical protein
MEKQIERGHSFYSPELARLMPKKYRKQLVEVKKRWRLRSGLKQRSDSNHSLPLPHHSFPTLTQHQTLVMELI